MKYLSLCSGIEAASVAWLPLGWQCAGVAEIEKFPCAVLAHRFPDVPNLGDVNAIARRQIEQLGHIDLVIFGFPCQDLSVAGKRKGLKDADGNVTRSGLFYRCAQIARWTKARWVVAENVPGLFSSHQGRDFAAVVGELAGAEFDVPRDGWRNAGFALGQNWLVEWAVLDAQYMHLAQRRERVFLVLDTGDWANRPPVLSDATSLRGHPAPRREAGKGAAYDVAPCIGASGRGFERTGETRGQDCVVAHSLRGVGFDASEDGTGLGTPLVAACLRSGSTNAASHNKPSGLGENLIPEIADCLQERDSKGSDSNTKNGHLLPVAFPAHLSSTQCASTENLSPSLQADNPTAVATMFERRMVRTSGGQPKEELSHALRADTNTGDAAPCVQFGMAVRRLTPEECEKLQGFPVGWTRIPWRNKPAENCPDGPRYKALGNSMAVPNIRWIGQQIEMAANYPQP